MFLIIDESISKFKEPQRSKIERMLRNFATSDSDGSHYITCDAKVLGKMKTRQMPEDILDFLKIACDHFINNAISPKDVNIICYVCLIDIDSEKEIRHKSKTTLKLSFTRFVNSKMTRETMFLLENDFESGFYKFVANYYINHNNIPADLSFQDDNGGGSHISKRFSKLQKNNRFLLCISETDKKYPNAVLGVTASSLQKVKEVSKHARYFIIQVNEIENLLPLQVIESIEKHRNNDTNIWLEKLERCYPEARFFFDFKNGFRNRILKNTEAMSYWEQVFVATSIDTGIQLSKCCNNHAENVKDKCIDFIKGYGQSLLSDVLESNICSNGTPCNVPSFLECVFLDVGKIVFSWTCSPIYEIC